MNRRSFLSSLVTTCVAVAAAGRMTFQPELKASAPADPPQNPLTPMDAALMEVAQRLQAHVEQVWQERIRLEYARMSCGAPPIPRGLPDNELTSYYAH